MLGMALQGQLPLGAGDLIHHTHPQNRKSETENYKECLWLVAEGNFKEGAYYSVADATEKVEAFKQHDLADCYFTPNGFNFPTHRSKGRGIQNVCNIDCLFTDLDYYGSDYAHLTPLELVDQIKTDVPWLPTPSVVMDSGRGVWLLWLFKRPLIINKTTRKKADWSPQWYTCQKFIWQLLAAYGADPQAIDASRYMRMPETLNSKSGAIAQAWVSYEKKDKRVDYLFTELQKLIRERQPKKKPKKNKSKGNPHGKIDGIETILNGFTLAHNRMKDMETIAEKRGPLNDRRKRMIACYLVEAAHFCTSTDSLTDTVDQFIEQHICDPDIYKAYYREHYRAIIHRADYVRNQVQKGKREQPFLKDARGNWKLSENRFIHTNKRIIQLLDISPQEMRKNSLRTLIDKHEKSLRRRERNNSMSRTAFLNRAQKRREEAQKLRLDGHSIREIAKIIGVGKSQVGRYVSKCPMYVL
jgi:hypothetical protein